MGYDPSLHFPRTCSFANKISIVRKIKWIGTFGHEQKEVELSEVNGTGGLWHLYIDRRWQGQFGECNGEWMYHPHRPPGWLTVADMQILCQLIADSYD